MIIGKDYLSQKSRGKADWVIVLDMDECLYVKDTKIFDKMKEGGYTICAPQWYDFVSEEIPVYTEGKLLHEISNKANKGCGKVVLFNPDKIYNINYTVGAHTCRPNGEIKYYNENVYVLHINKHLSFEYLLKKYKELNNRQSDTNKKNNWCIHYAFSEERLKNDYDKSLNNAIDFNELVNK